MRGESGDEIDVVVGDAGGGEHADILGDDLRGVLAAGAADFGIDKRLSAKADAVDAGRGPGAGFLHSDGSRSGFERCFGPWTSGNEGEEFGKIRRGPSGSACRRRGRPFRAVHCQTCARNSA